jgi:hypothetical protein
MGDIYVPFVKVVDHMYVFSFKSQFTYTTHRKIDALAYRARRDFETIATGVPFEVKILFKKSSPVPTEERIQHLSPPPFSASNAHKAMSRRCGSLAVIMQDKGRPANHVTHEFVVFTLTKATTEQRYYSITSWMTNKKKLPWLSDCDRN